MRYTYKYIIQNPKEGIYEHVELFFILFRQFCKWYLKDHTRWIVINCILEIGKDKTTFIYTWPQGNIGMRQDLMRLGVISAIGLPAHQMDEARGRIVER